MSSPVRMSGMEQDLSGSFCRLCPPLTPVPRARWAGEAVCRLR